MSDIVHLLCTEAVTRGMLFLDTSGKNYIPQTGIYSSSDRVGRGLADFVRMWAQMLPLASRQKVVNHPVVEIINNLILDHGLVIITPWNKAEIKEQEEPALPRVPQDEPTIHYAGADIQRYKRYRVQDVDGMLTAQDVINLIREGTVRPEVLIKVIGADTHWRRAELFPEFQQALKEGPMSGSGGGLATSAMIGDVPSQETQSHFLYFSRLRVPNLAPHHVSSVEETFIIEPTSVFHWMSKVAKGQPPVDTLTAVQLLHPKKATQAKARARP